MCLFERFASLNEFKFPRAVDDVHARWMMSTTSDLRVTIQRGNWGPEPTVFSLNPLKGNPQNYPRAQESPMKKGEYHSIQQHTMDNQ
ncbi:MAG: hypothetical protein MAG451_02890 [Anaerolineales bacterium]|nr:hypothetical protein [Anaerolineales bacterium]